jgi:hypothetical protein
MTLPPLFFPVYTLGVFVFSFRLRTLYPRIFVHVYREGLV